MALRPARTGRSVRLILLRGTAGLVLPDKPAAAPRQMAAARDLVGMHYSSQRPMISARVALSPLYRQGLALPYCERRRRRGRISLPADALARRYPAAVRGSHRAPAGRALLRAAVVRLFFLVAKLGPHGHAVGSRSSKQFPEDLTIPGYFLIKVRHWLLALLAFLQALIDIARPAPPRDSHGDCGPSGCWRRSRSC